MEVRPPPSASSFTMFQCASNIYIICLCRFHLAASRSPGEVSEAALVRDILYVFQGIDGKFIKMSAQENCYKIDSKVPTGYIKLCTVRQITQLQAVHIPQHGKVYI